MKFKLEDISLKISKGSTPRGKVNYSLDENNLFLRVTDLNELQHIETAEYTLSDDDIKKNKIKIWPSNTVLVSIEGTVGKVAMLKKPMAFNQAIAGIIPDEEKVIPEYLMYYLRQTPTISSILKGTIMPALRLGDLSSIELDLPDLRTQQKIVRILSALDQKIELNNNESNTLQSIIDTQYRKVFSGNESNNKVKASDLFDYEGGYSYTSAELVDASNIGMMTIKNFERTGGFKVDGFKALSPKKETIKTAALYDIFVSCTDVTQNADIIGNAVMLLDTDKYSTVTYSMDLVRIIPKINRFTLYAILCSKDFKSFALGYKSGTTVLHLNKKCLTEYEIALPDERSLDFFGATVERACKKIAINLNENRTLRQMRDTLLPKLMSGEININGIQSL